MSRHFFGGEVRGKMKGGKGKEQETGRIKERCAIFITIEVGYPKNQSSHSIQSLSFLPLCFRCYHRRVPSSTHRRRLFLLSESVYGTPYPSTEPRPTPACACC